LAKFSQVIYGMPLAYRVNRLLLYDHARTDRRTHGRTHGRTDSPKTKSLRCL